MIVEMTDTNAEENPFEVVFNFKRNSDTNYLDETVVRQRLAQIFSSVMKMRTLNPKICTFTLKQGRRKAAHNLHLMNLYNICDKPYLR